jgi:hypothetical protein
MWRPKQNRIFCLSSNKLVTMRSWIISGFITPVPVLKEGIHLSRWRGESMIRLLLWVRYWISRQRSSILTKEILEERITLSVLKARSRWAKKRNYDRFFGFIGLSQQMMSQVSMQPQTSSTDTAMPQTPHLKASPFYTLLRNFLDYLLHYLFYYLLLSHDFLPVISKL